MDAINFIDLNLANVVILFVVGFIGGMVSGFIGSGGAFVLTPAMMSLGASGIVAVASNMAHKFPKALVGSIKRHKYGQVDIKLGIIMGIFAEAGVFYGKEVLTGIREQFGNAGTDLYVSFVFIVVLASRLIKLPVYFSELELISALDPTLISILDKTSFATLALALIAGMIAILAALIKGMIEHRRDTEAERALQSYEKDLAVSTADS